MKQTKQTVKKLIASWGITVIEQLPATVGIVTGLGLHLLVSGSNFFLSLALGLVAGTQVAKVTLRELHDASSALHRGASDMYERIGIWGGLEYCDCSDCTFAEPPF